MPVSEKEAAEEQGKNAEDEEMAEVVDSKNSVMRFNVLAKDAM